MIELLLQAERALTMGMIDQAERLYRQAVAADPRNSIAVVGLARVAIERTDDEGALREARRALVIDPENVAAARLAARLQQVLGYPSSSAPVATPGDASVTSPPVVRPTPAVTPAPAPRQGVVDRLLRRNCP